MVNYQRLKLFRGMGAAIAGQFDGYVGDQVQVRPFVNKAGSGEIWTIATPATVDASRAYKINVAGVAEVSFTTDANPTQTELRNGLIAAWKLNALAFSALAPSVSGNNILLTAKKNTHRFTITVNVSETTSDLTATKTTSATEAATIPFAVFVATEAGYPAGLAKLPSAGSDRLIGVAMNWTVERQGIGEFATQGYVDGADFDVLTQTGANVGYFVRCVESDLTHTDTLYVSHSGATAGFVTRSNTNSIALAGLAKIPIGKKAIWSSPDNCYIVPVAITG